ncbi:MAG: excinuclease ABC subunit UvrA [Verrucomicrobiales bacterium]|nr:excinuclease ABC subunit UvrA [Verrucomicrobiales bacterium]
MSAIRLRGVRHNNLKNFNLDLPMGKLLVVTGVSGSGKSSLAFDTLYAEGQRRYIETFSPYARQFFDRMDKPQVDKIEGIPPAIAIEQRNTVKTTRSTVGTMTEICDYMKVVWSHLAQLHCRQCGQPVRKDSPQQIWETLKSEMADRRSGIGDGRSAPNSELLVTFDLPLSEKLSVEESLALVAKQGYQRLLVPDTDETAGHGALTLHEAIIPFGPARETPGFSVVRVEEAAERWARARPLSLTVIQDRLKLVDGSRARFIEACEQAYHFGKGKLALYSTGPGPGRSPSAILQPQPFSRRLHCAQCDIEYREPSPGLFSFNNPVGACPTCRGFGRTITIDYHLAIPDHSLSLAQGAVKPWQTGHGAECQADLTKFCRHHGIPMHVPFRELKSEWRDWIVDGDPDYGKDEEHEWPRAWYGVKGYFRWLESKAYKMHVRVLLSRYRAYRTCPDCGGKRLKPDALLYRVSLPTAQTMDAPIPLTPALSPGEREKSSPRGPIGESLRPCDVRVWSPPLSEGEGRGEGGSMPTLSLADFYQLSVSRALRFVDALVAKQSKGRKNDPLALVMNEVRSRLGYLEEVGLGYLSLDRPTRSLSGGETERVSLTTCLGSRLVNTLFVLDEPSVGLHPRDTARLVRVLERLRDAGNTVLVVEHEAVVMHAADQIVDLGPGHGEAGGALVFQGTFQEIQKCPDSLTGRYLSGRQRIEIPKRRLIDWQTSKLTVLQAALHNLKNLTVEIPLGRLVCVTGVSGSGKTTLVREVLLPPLCAEFQANSERVPAPCDDVSETATNSDTDGSEKSAIANRQSAIAGWQSLGRVVLVDQSPLGRTPRSNPAVYIGAFDDVRELFAQSELAKRRGLSASAFSFNSNQGQCETCRGAGFEKIEMQFLSDVYIRCPECKGRRYRPHILEVTLSGRRASEVENSELRTPNSELALSRIGSAADKAGWSIADLLEAPVDDAIGFLSAFAGSRPAERATRSLKLLQDVGLGYLRLGQPINTLSGGESQRLKLVSYLVEFQQAQGLEPKRTLFLFDEPTTGLHFDDVRVLLQVFQRLVDAGHSVLIIEHNVDVIKCADWVIDLGPEAGEAGGEVVVAGTPEDVASCERSHTGQALIGLLKS